MLHNCIHFLLTSKHSPKFPSPGPVPSHHHEAFGPYSPSPNAQGEEPVPVLLSRLPYFWTQ